jgi:hypothetical protein
MGQIVINLPKRHDIQLKKLRVKTKFIEEFKADCKRNYTLQEEVDDILNGYEGIRGLLWASFSWSKSIYGLKYWKSVYEKAKAMECGSLPDN